MDAGALDRRVTIERATIMTDDYGTATQTWAALATVWASVEWIRDGERWAAAQVVAEATLRVQTRYRDVKTTDRLIYEDVVYNIVGVKEIGRRDGLEITCAGRADES